MTLLESDTDFVGAIHGEEVSFYYFVDVTFEEESLRALLISSSSLALINRSHKKRRYL